MPTLSNYFQLVLTHLPSLPDSCSFEQAALAEPLSVLIHATRRAGLKAGQTVLVYGVGAIGLLACSVAQSTGAARVVAIDNNQTRLNFAKANGFASQVICLPPTDRAKTTDEQLRRAKENAQSVLSEFGATEGFDVVFECTGAEPVIQMSVHVSRHFSGSSCFLRFTDCFSLPSDRNRRRQGHAHWNGHAQRHAPPLYCRTAGS